MITNTKIASIVETRLNAVATTLALDIKFKIFAYAEDYYRDKTTNYVNGLIMELPSSVVPINGMNAYYANYSLKIPTKWENRDDVGMILTESISSFRGVSSVETDDNGVAFSCVSNCSMPANEGAQIQATVGKSINFEMSLYFQLIEGGVLSNSCVWKLDGTQLLKIDGATTRAKILQTDNIANDLEMKSYVSQQGLQFNFNSPYLSDALHKSLVQDIMNGGFQENYILTYYDNVTYLEASPKSWEVVLKTGSINEQTGTIVMLALEFVLSRS